MKNNIQETSLFVYEIVKPHLNEMEERVYKCILSFQGLTSHEIAGRLNKSVNCITPRLNSLLYDKQMVKIDGKIANRSLYFIRKNTDPLNMRELTPLEKLAQFKLWLSGKGLYVCTQEAINKLNELI